MTFWILLALATVLSFMCLHYINILLSLGASIGWISLMAYNLAHPPANITQGSAIHQWMTMGFMAIALAMMLMWVGNRRRGYTGYPITKREQVDLESRYERSQPQKGRMEMSEAEYRADVHKRLHQHRRGR
jgi:hypothetical protein